MKQIKLSKGLSVENIMESRIKHDTTVITFTEQAALTTVGVMVVGCLLGMSAVLGGLL